MGTECQFGKMKESWRRMWRLHNNVNGLNTPELCALKCLRW